MHIRYIEYMKNNILNLVHELNPSKSGGEEMAGNGRARLHACTPLTAQPPDASAFITILDTNECIHLVTNVVPESDVLSLALTCRALRNVLWARFQPRPEGDPHAGKRVRTRLPTDTGQFWAYHWAYNRQTGAWCAVRHDIVYSAWRPLEIFRGFIINANLGPFEASNNRNRWKGLEDDTSCNFYSINWSGCQRASMSLDSDNPEILFWYPRPNILHDNPELEPFLDAYDSHMKINQPMGRLSPMSIDDMVSFDHHIRCDINQKVRQGLGSAHNAYVDTDRGVYACKDMCVQCGQPCPCKRECKHWRDIEGREGKLLNYETNELEER